MKVYGKSHQNYWKEGDRLFRPSYSRNGDTQEVRSYCTKMQFKGRRVQFNLQSENKELAAIKARDIYLSLHSQGWPETIAKYKPDAEAEIHSPTVGEFIAEVSEHTNVTRNTLVTYVRKFRFLVASIAKVKSSRSKFAPGSKEQTEYQAKVDAVELATLTPAKINSWKKQYIKKAGDDMDAKRSRCVTVNSILRNSKCLFTPEVLVFVASEYKGLRTVSSKYGEKILKGRLSIPFYPFEDVIPEKVAKRKYVSQRVGMNIELLYEAAKNELASAEPEQYKIFLLCATAALRRKEVDWLKWEHLDFGSNRINVQSTEYSQLKTQESEGCVDVNQTVMDIFRSYKQSSKSEFVVESKRKARTPKEPSDYRCSASFRKLNKWLRSQGITSQKPIHTLRQEAVSLVAEKEGIHAASTLARHSDIRITSDVYAEHRAPVAVSMESLTGETPKALSDESTKSA
jgi:integrase